MEQTVPHKSANKRIAFRILVFLILNIVLGLLFCNDPFLAFTVDFILFIWIALPAMILAVIWPLMLENRPTWRGLKIGHVCRFIVISIILLLPMCLIAMMAADYRLEATKRHCEHLIPQLESWREQNGHYPLSLVEVGESQSSRWLLDYDYRPAENSFSFTIMDPSAMMTMWFYENDRGQWVKDS